NKQSLGWAGLLQTERIAGGNYGDHAQTVELDAVELAFVNLPTHDGVLADEVDFRIRETLARPDVASPGLDILAGQPRGAARTGDCKDSKSGEREPAFHGWNLLLGRTGPEGRTRPF